MTATDPHQIALAQLELERASLNITQLEYEATKARLQEAHHIATRPWRILLLVVLLAPVLLIGGCFAMIALAPKSTDYSSAVTAACRDSVREQLKSPSTANFSNEMVSEVAATDPYKAYKIVGTVDSQNSFGATIRTRWVCTGSSTSSSSSDAMGTAALDPE